MPVLGKGDLKELWSGCGYHLQQADFHRDCQAKGQNVKNHDSKKRWKTNLTTAVVTLAQGMLQLTTRIFLKGTKFFHRDIF